MELEQVSKGNEKVPPGIKRHIKRADSDMTSGSIWRLLITFALPLAAGLLFQQLYNTVDTIVVGKFVGKEALAAVGSTSSIINMLVGLCSGLSMGASVVISQSYGAKDYVRLHDAVHTTILVTIIMSVIATGVGMAIVDPMLTMMSTPDDVFGAAHDYLTIYFAGISGLFIYNMGSAILRAVGDSRRPLYFLIFSAVLNVILDLVFVIVFKMDIAGAAYATIVSQFLSAALVLFVLTRSAGPYAIHWGHLCIKGNILKQVLSIGLPSGVQQGLTSFSNVFVQSYVNAFGSDCMAGWSSYNKLDVYALVPAQSIAMASTTFVGQNYGARKLERARQGVKQALIMSISMTIFLCALLLIFRDQLLTLFTNDSLVIQYGSRFIGMIAPFYFCTCFNQTFAGAMRGIGKAKVPMIVMLSSFVVFRQIFLYVGTKLGGGFVLVSLAYPMGWVVCSIAMYVCYKRSALCHPEKAQFAAADTAKDGNTEDTIETADEGIE